MKSDKRIHVSWAIAWIALALPALGYSQTVADNQVPRLPSTSEIHAADWKGRRDAYEALMNVEETPANVDRRRRLLFELLVVENETVAAGNARLLQRVAAGLPPDGDFTEEYSEHYASVIAAVARLDDPRSAPALAGAISTGWMAVGSLIAFGPVAVEPVARRIDEADPTVRSSVAYVLFEMLGRSDAIANDAASRAIIKNALVRAARDPEYLVRRRSVAGLVRLGDPESIAIVQDLARNDAYVDTLPGRKGTYPVREAAVTALTTLRPR